MGRAYRVDLPYGLVNEIRDLLYALDDAREEYEAACEQESQTSAPDVRSFEDWEDARLAFADAAEALLRGLVE